MTTPIWGAGEPLEAAEVPAVSPKLASGSNGADANPRGAPPLGAAVAVTPDSGMFAPANDGEGDTAVSWARAPNAKSRTNAHAQLAYFIAYSPPSSRT